MNSKHFRLFTYFSIASYIIVLLIKKDVFSSIGVAVTLAVVVDIIYSTFLWRINPFEKTPRLKKRYQSIQKSSYKGGTTFNVDITVRQTLFSVYIQEQWDGNHCGSVSSTLVKEHNESWVLIYTYLTHPNNVVCDHIDDMHYGTAMLHIESPKKLSGSYFTNRQEMTRGSIVWIAI